MVHCLGWSEPCDWWHDAKSVAGQHDEVGGVSGDARSNGVVNKVNRIGRSSVLS